MENFRIWLESQLDAYNQAIFDILVAQQIDPYEAQQLIAKQQEAILDGQQIGLSPNEQAKMIYKIWQRQSDNQHMRDMQRDTKQDQQLASDIRDGKRPKGNFIPTQDQRDQLNTVRQNLPQ